MSDTAYNGWTNRQTWNVSLWLNESPSLSMHMHEILRENTDDEKAGEQIKSLCKDVWRQSDGTSPQTPDKVGLGGVNWTEIARDNREL